MIWEYQNIFGHIRNTDKIHKDLELYQIFIQNFLSQGLQILSHHILLTRTKNIFTPSANFYHYSTLPVKIVYTPFFSSSEKHQSHHVVGCHAAGIYFLLISFLKALLCVYSSYNASFEFSCE